MCGWTYLFRKLPSEAGDLEELARRLRVSLFNSEVTKYGKTGTDTYEVQRRILESLRHRRDSCLWLLALLSALAAVCSAAAAWWAVFIATGHGK